MDLVEVDIVGAEPLQARLDRVHDVAARRAAVVGALADGAEGLGGEHEVGARAAGIGQRPAGDLLRQAFGIDVGGVDEVDAGVERAGDDAVGGRLVEVADMGPDAAATAEGHGAEADFGYEQARTAEGLVAHEDDPS